MGLFRLRVEVNPKNVEKLDEIASRLKDFSVVFSNIIDEWATGNVKRKFARGLGAERTGIDQPPAEWKPVSQAYYRQKHGPIVRGSRTLFPDWLMVKTGTLMNALGRRGGFTEYVDAHRAVFGTPIDPDAAAAAIGNKETRPTVFFDRTDRHAIRRELQQYLSMGANYRNMMWESARRKTLIKKQIKEMDLNFSATINR